LHPRERIGAARATCKPRVVDDERTERPSIAAAIDPTNGATGDDSNASAVLRPASNTRSPTTITTLGRGFLPR
jgi:hypothetical protein